MLQFSMVSIFFFEMSNPLLSKPAGPHYGSPCLSMYWVGLKLRSEGSDRLREKCRAVHESSWMSCWKLGSIHGDRINGLVITDPYKWETSLG